MLETITLMENENLQKGIGENENEIRNQIGKIKNLCKSMELELEQKRIQYELNIETTKSIRDKTICKRYYKYKQLHDYFRKLHEIQSKSNNEKCEAILKVYKNKKCFTNYFELVENYKSTRGILIYNRSNITLNRRKSSKFN